jgi:hypothetical protein
MEHHKQTLYRTAKFMSDQEITSIAEQVHAGHPEASYPLVEAITRDVVQKIVVNAPRKFLRGLSAAEREAKIAEMIRNGYTNKDVAQAVGLTAPRVSQIAKQLREKGADLPVRKKGARSIDMADVMAALHHYRCGMLPKEVADHMSISTENALRAYKRLRAAGEQMPDLKQVQDWRDALDHTLAAAKEAEAAYLANDSLVYTQEELQAAAVVAIRRYKETKKAMPAGVVGLPPAHAKRPN